MTALPSTSVVVPVLNGAATIGDLLSALRGQARAPANTEIIVVDNGSTDATVDIVKEFGVTLMHETIRGPAAARNHGLHHASGEVIAHLDADTLPARTWLAELVEPFADPHVHLAAGKTLSFRPETPAERYFARAQLYDAETNVHRPVLPFAASLNMAVRRTSALAIHGWAEDMITAEDVEFSHRLLEAFPSEIVYQPSAVLFHRNRRTDAELCRQAWTYGEGVAHLYQRYPDRLTWGVPQTLHVVRSVVQRWIIARTLRLGRSVRLASLEEHEFAHYHWLWTWWFWRGFQSMYRHGERRVS